MSNKGSYQRRGFTTIYVPACLCVMGQRVRPQKQHIGWPMQTAVLSAVHAAWTQRHLLSKALSHPKTRDLLSWPKISCHLKQHQVRGNTGAGWSPYSVYTRKEKKETARPENKDEEKNEHCLCRASPWDKIMFSSSRCIVTWQNTRHFVTNNVLSFDAAQTEGNTGGDWRPHVAWKQRRRKQNLEIVEMSQNWSEKLKICEHQPRHPWFESAETWGQFLTHFSQQGVIVRCASCRHFRNIASFNHVFWDWVFSRFSP